MSDKTALQLDGPLLNESGEFPNAAALLAKNLLGVCSTDLKSEMSHHGQVHTEFAGAHDHFGAGMGNADFAAGEACKQT